jgi:hypothetical protein
MEHINTLYEFHRWLASVQSEEPVHRRLATGGLPAPAQGTHRRTATPSKKHVSQSLLVNQKCARVRLNTKRNILKKHIAEDSYMADGSDLTSSQLGCCCAYVDRKYGSARP